MAALKQARRLVVKIGSALLVDRAQGELRYDWLASLAQDVANIKSRGTDVVLVSSGSIALGRRVLGLADGPLGLEYSQAAAAVGQIQLARAYEQVLAPHGITAAQVLVTLEDSADRRRYLNMRSTMETLISLDAVPIVNENDTTATNEIRYGDNDRLAARVAQIMSADTLIMLSDIDGLYTQDPTKFKNAKHLKKVTKITDQIIKSATKSISDYGSGGMITKIDAAKICMNAGCKMILTKGSMNNPIKNLEKNTICTIFMPHINKYNAKKK